MKQTLVMKRCSVILFVLMSMITYAQTAVSQIKVTGTVTDNTGMPLSGVNVTEKSSKNSVTTDFTGNYQITVKSDATLVFSFIGMRKIEMPLAGRTVLNTKLQDDTNQLESVVIVAYGTQKKKDLTGAIATIKPEVLMDLPSTNLAESLKGLVPGLSVTGGSGRPGDAATIQIRQTFGFSKDGNTTIPLIVIDDMVQVDPATGRATMDAFNRLDPSEIESLTILKDASAAIYGSRASQGAVIVKTKRGKAGKAKFSYNSQFTINDAVSHTKTMDAYEFGVFSNRFLTTATPTITAPNLFSAKELEEMKSLDYDWLKEAWKPATQQKHSFNVNGGNDDITYFAGATYLTQDANLGYQKYDKWNYRTGINAKISKDLDFSASISGNSGFIDKSFTKASANISDSGYGSSAGGEQADYGYLVHMPKFVPWQTTVDGKQYYMSPFPNSNKTFGSANANTTIAGWNYFANLNNGSHQTTDDSSFNVNASVNYKIAAVKGLSVKASYARTKNSSYAEQIQLPYDLARIVNINTTVDNHLVSEAYPSAVIKNPEVGGVIDYALETNKVNARVYYNSNFSKSSQADFFVNYNRTFGSHQVSGMFGIERSESDWTSTRLAYTNTPKDYMGTYVTAGTVDTSNSTALKGNNALLSYFGTVNYSYQSKYLAQFLIRSDASTKFAPENYWGTFPSLQLGWVISKEAWFENVKAVNFFKLRYSIGKTGKDNLAPFKYLQLYDLTVNKGEQFGPNGGQLGTGLTPKVNPNRDAAWDTTLKNNIGIDMAFLDNRLQFNADFYYDITKDMLTDMGAATGVPLSVGGGFAEQNYAQVDAWGSEISVNWSDNIKGKIKYDIGMNFGYADNKIIKYPDQGNLAPANNAQREGYSVGFNPVWGFKTWNGTSTGDGILRTDTDISNYWNYLTQLATAAGTTPSYLTITDPTTIKKGSLAFQDLGGALNADGTIGAPNGRVEALNDYAKLANSSRTYTINTSLGMKYEHFSLRTQIVTSWGGANFVDLVSQSTSSASNMWAREPFWNDMYGADNVNGKYPSLAGTGALSTSDFWQISTFRCFIRNLTVAYEFPKQVFTNTSIQNISLGITGNNLWDFYNPYPGHYRNMYDNSSVGYPTLRSWTLNLNILF